MSSEQDASKAGEGDNFCVDIDRIELATYRVIHGRKINPSLSPEYLIPQKY